MKFSRNVPAVFSLLLVSSVTAGAMYVTLGAAVDDAETLPPVQEVSAEASDSSAGFSVPVTEAHNAGRTAEESFQKRSHDIKLRSDGALVGRLRHPADPSSDEASLAGVEVRLMGGGKLEGRAITSDQGVFILSDVRPGVYGLIARGKNAYAAIGIRVVAGAVTEGGDPASENAFSIDTHVAMPRDFPTVRQLIEENLPVESTPTDAGADAGTSAGQSYEDVAGSGEPATSLAGHQLQLNPDGSIEGVINPLTPTGGLVTAVQDLTVFFVMDNVVKGSSRVNADGSFVVAGLTPGVYTEVGVGRDGVLVLGVDVVGAFASVTARSSEYRLTSIKLAAQFSAAPVPLENYVPGDDDDDAPTTVADDTTAAAPVSGGPLGGGGATGVAGGGGGGGGFGAGGGLGTLLGVGAAAGVAAAIADNDDDKPASPGN